MMIPKNKNVSKIFEKKSTFLHNNRSKIVKKPNSQEIIFGENMASSHGLNEKQESMQLNTDIEKD